MTSSPLLRDIYLVLFLSSFAIVHVDPQIYLADRSAGHVSCCQLDDVTICEDEELLIYF